MSVSGYLVTISDINGNDAWEVVFGNNFVNTLTCRDGLTGSVLWTHTIGGDVWELSTIADITGDGIQEVLVTPQGSGFEVLYGNNGSSYWNSGIAGSKNPKGFVDDRGRPLIANNDGTIRVYNMTSKTLLASVPAVFDEPFEFMDNPDPRQPGYHIILDKNKHTLEIFFIGNYSGPSDKFGYHLEYFFALLW